jgi:hypothetical protein
MNRIPRYTADEFEREARYIENLIWDAVVVEPGARVLFCGYAEDGKWIKRALEAGAEVTVIEHREEVIRRFEDMGARLLRGSTSVIPAKNESFDLAVAYHYLHEADPFFHGQILSELARVAHRIAIIEPGPPADEVGKRIARLYSQAKREFGQFEYYQPLEYWRKLLQAVKADVAQHVFAFAKVPPREYLRDTIELLLDTMEAEDAPESDMEQLRALARRSDAMMLPPPRYVIVGAAIGDLPQPVFTPREEPTPTPQIAKAAQSSQPVEPAPVPPAGPPTLPGAPVNAPQAWTPPPPIAFGLPEIPPAPTPFAVPEIPPGPIPPAGPPGWHWEPPDTEAPES